MTDGPGPGADDWVRTGVGSLDVLVAADRSGRALAAAPLAVVGPDGGPVLSVTLLLDRSPPVDIGAVAPLVRAASLAFDVTIGLPDDVLEALGPDHRRLYPEFVHYALCRDEPAGTTEVLTVADASGPLARAALTTMLDRDAALDLLGALRGAPSALTVTADVAYRSAGPTVQVRHRGTWAEVHDALARHAGADRTVGVDAVRAAVVELLAGGALQVSGVPTADLDVDVVTRTVLTQCDVVLDRVGTPWTLRARPDPAFPFDHVLQLAGRRTGSVRSAAALDAVLGDPLAGRALEPYVGLVAPGTGGGLPPVPRRGRSRRGPRRGEDGHTVPLHARPDGRLEAVTVLSSPARPFLASAAFQAAAATVPDRFPVLHLPLDDVVVGSRPRHLPVLDDPAGPVWRDRDDALVRWYAPDLEAVLPGPAGAVDGSPFVFRFRRVGVTDDLRPALEGTVTVTVCRVLPSGARAAAGDAELRPVPMGQVGAALEIPFVDRDDGQAKHHALEGSVRETGDGWEVTVALANDWLRLCYRALSAADPDAPPAVLRLDYTFPAWTPVRRRELPVMFAGKTALTAVAFAAVDAGRSPREAVLDAGTLTLRASGTEVRFRRERGQDHPLLTAGGRGPAAVGTAVLAGRPLVVQSNLTVVRPVLRPPELSGQFQAEDPQLVQRTVARRGTAQVSAPCETYGAFYRETTAGADTAVGCRDELKLGTVRYELFRLLPELSSERFAVHRMLQQPGRFLVVPAAYGLTRHGPGTGERSYRPCVALYGVFDPADPTTTRLALDGTLQPDLAPHELDELRTRLGTLAADPRILLPTEIEGVTATFDWAVPGARSTHSTVVLPGGLVRLGVDTDLADWLLMHQQLQLSSFSGAATFAFPDGITLRSALVFDLARVLGPVDGGPVEVRLAGTTGTVVNRVERPVDVEALSCAGRDGRSRVDVGRSLAAGATLDVTVPAGTTAAVPTVHLPRTGPVTIEESRSFLDQVETNVVLVNLVDLASRGLARLEVTARLRDVQGERSVQLTDEVATAEARFVLPLTRYLAARVLRYRITAVGTDGSATTGDEQEWDLAAGGNVISITWATAEPTSGTATRGATP